MKGESIKLLLKQYNISNNELAAKMGMTPQNLSQLLSKDDVKSGTLERISQASGISIAVLYGEPTQSATVTGDNSTAVAGNGNQVNAGKLIDEVAAQRRLTGYDREYRDMFLLIFALIGINITDLFNLDYESLNAGRITYRRAKTGTIYDIRVEPAAAELPERYRGESGLLCIRDRYRSARDYTQHINAGLKRLIQEPPFTELSTYWARHSWATIAYNELGASMDTISAALGHKYGSRVTVIYINPDQKRVDDLNLRMMELIFDV